MTVVISLNAVLAIGIPKVSAVELPLSELVEGVHDIQGALAFPIIAPRYLPTNENLFWKASVYEGRYSISFGYQSHCTDSTACNWGFFTGAKQSDLDSGNTKGEKVNLAKGRVGYYTVQRGTAPYELLSWNQNGGSYTVQVKGGRKGQLIAIANSAIDPNNTASLSPGGFNAEIIDPPTNCRANPGSGNSIQKVLQRGDVRVNLVSPRYDDKGGEWYQEQSLGCWIHQSQMKFK